MAHHVTGSPFQSILHSFRLPLQSTHVQAPCWADITDAASRLKTSVAKALQSYPCTRKAIFYVQQRCGLATPLTILQRTVSETTGFPDAVTQLVLDYRQCRVHKSRQINEIRKETRLRRLCRKTIAYEPARSVVMGVALGTVGAAVSAGALTWMGDCQTQLLMPAIGVVNVATGFILKSSARSLRWLEDSDFIASSTCFTSGAVSQYMFNGEDAFPRKVKTGVGIIMGPYFRYLTDRGEAGEDERFQQFCIDTSIAALGAISGAYAALGRALITFEATILAIELAKQRFPTLSPWKPASAGKPASAEKMSPALKSVRNTALALICANTLQQLNTGSLIPAEILVPAGGIIAGGLVAYQQKFQR